MKKLWGITGVIYLAFAVYFSVKIYTSIFAPLSGLEGEMVKNAVKDVLLDDLKVSALGGYINYDQIRFLAKSLTIEERKEFFILIKHHSKQFKRSSEFQTMMGLIENESE